MIVRARGDILGVSFDPKEEFWARQQGSQREFNSGFKATVCTPPLKKVEWHLKVAVGDRPTVGATSERRDDACCTIGFIVYRGRATGEDASAAWRVAGAARFEGAGD